jgi:hypothetical protein
MPRFYFDVREGACFIPDEEGLEVANLDQAEREAAKAEKVTSLLRPVGRNRAATSRRPRSKAPSWLRLSTISLPI